ncbi:hypothetical protein [Agromyces sp. NPDC058110]|uniref:hypothetical protein n=1 Tax=Agromyces sp. NPDC058110 TaxID=3346345 RepID=UPI0036DE0671
MCFAADAMLGPHESKILRIVVRVTLATTFGRLPTWAKVTSLVSAAVIVLGAVAVPVAAAAVDQNDRRLARELAETEAAAELRLAAEAAKVLGETKESAAEVNADWAGFSASLGNAVSPDAAAAFETARVDLSLAIASGGVEEMTSAMKALVTAMEQLVSSAARQAEALLSASPLADPASKDELMAAVAAMDASFDARVVLTRVKEASDAVVASQAAGQAAADAAAAAAAERSAAEADERSAADGAPEGGSGDEPTTWQPNGALDPGVLGMNPWELESCDDVAPGQVIHIDFEWQAREGNTVDISYALSPDPSLATAGFTQIVTGGASAGTVRIPRTCPTGVEQRPFVSIVVVASNEYGSSTANYWGL